MGSDLLPWILFVSVMGFFLALDLGLIGRKVHVIKMKEAIIRSCMWISIALLFNLWVWYSRGSSDAIKFLTGYLVELSLSVDNLFVFLLIFSYFGIPEQYRYKVLFWGILGAVVMRILFIWGGVIIIERFHWMLYVFGAFLVYTGIKLALEKDKEYDPEQNPMVKLANRFFYVDHNPNQPNFFIMKDGKRYATPLFMTLLALETTDVVFALDSIPAIFGITKDPYIIFTSNICAILGLRSMYFALSGLMTLFHHLHYGLSAILIFIGIKMLIEPWFHVPILYSLGFIAFCLVASVVASLLDKKDVTP